MVYKNINHLLSRELCKQLNLNWLVNHQIKRLITRACLERIFNKKITNEREIVKWFIKTNRLTCSTEYLYKVFVNDIMNKYEVLRYLFIAKDQDVFLKRLIKESTKSKSEEIGHESFFINNISLTDLIKQYNILNKKIDFSWSIKRIEAEHKNATNTLMEYELKLLKNEETRDTPIKQALLKFPSYTIEKLITDRISLFKEGREQEHCVYTNYQYQAMDSDYFVYQIQYLNERITLGLRTINITTEYLKFDQAFLKRNKAISPMAKAYIDDFIKRLNAHLFLLVDKSMPVPVMLSHQFLDV